MKQEVQHTPLCSTGVMAAAVLETKGRRQANDGPGSRTRVAPSPLVTPSPPGGWPRTAK